MSEQRIARGALNRTPAAEAAELRGVQGEAWEVYCAHGDVFDARFIESPNDPLRCACSRVEFDGALGRCGMQATEEDGLCDVCRHDREMLFDVHHLTDVPLEWATDGTLNARSHSGLIRRIDSPQA